MILTSTHNLSYHPQRIVSLVPSQTELLYYLQLNEKIAGITKFCIHPTEWFRSKIKVGGTKNINFDTIDNIQPDLIIANKEENEKGQIEKLAERYNIWLTDVKNLSDALQMINDIGILTDKQKEAGQLAENITKAFLHLIPTAKTIRTAYLIWKNPYMTIGSNTFIHDMLSKCGLQNIFENEKRYPETSIQQLIDQNCQLILLSSEPYPFQQQHAEEIVALIPDCKICLVNGEYFSWYGSRLLSAPPYFSNLIENIFNK